MKSQANQKRLKTLGLIKTCSMSLSTGPALLRSDAMLPFLDIHYNKYSSAKFLLHFTLISSNAKTLERLYVIYIRGMLVFDLEIKTLTSLATVFFSSSRSIRISKGLTFSKSRILKSSLFFCFIFIFIGVLFTFCVIIHFFKFLVKFGLS